MFKADKRLKRVYDTYNRKYFDGLLAGDVEVGWDDGQTELQKQRLGMTVVTTFDENEGKGQHVRIMLNPDCLTAGGTVVRMTLIHEMAHVKLHPYMAHGKRFQEEMLRLAMRGAFKDLW